MADMKSIILSYIMVYYNRRRIYTSNPGGWPPAIYRERMLSQALVTGFLYEGVFNCTFFDNSMHQLN